MMRIHSFRILVWLAVVCGTLHGGASGAADPGPKRAFVFRGVGYFHRWADHGQHEFTPEGQEDLEKWSDMITVNLYPSAGDGERLAAVANAALENYKQHGARVLKTRSIPRRGDRPAEHFIAVEFTRPDFIEIAIARFKLGDGKGCSFVYSHRIYGQEIANQMSVWLTANSAEAEKALMEWSSMPSPTLLSQELL